MLDALRRGVALWPEQPEYRESLAIALAQSGRVAEALPHFAAIIQMDPDSADARFNLGCALLELDRHEESAAQFSAYLKIRPHSAQALTNIGACYIGLGRYSDAESALQRALIRDPKMVDAFSNLGTVQSLRGRYGEAERSFLTGLQHDPNHVGMCVKLGWLLIRRGAWDDADEAFTRALAVRPNSARAVSGLATVKERKGDLDSAYSLLEAGRGFGRNLPIFAQTYALVCRRLKKPEQAIPMVEECIEHLSGGEDEAGLLHAYGDLMDALGRHDAAFAAHTRANQARNQEFDADEHSSFVDELIRVFSSSAFRQLPGSFADAEPIFVVGMPRSGTSLVEQILASHSQVYGAGEQTGLLHLVGQMPFYLRDRRPYPTCVDALSVVDLDNIAANYIDRLPEASRESRRVVDKMPFNFLHLGLISLLFPNAKIVHCVRDPEDTCLSLYFQQFSPFYAFSTSVTGLGRYYRDYQRVMAHWQSVLPIPIHSIVYEELVADPDTEIPRLLAACSLEVEPACSRFWENPRQVDTASYAQVRRPLYKSAIKRSAPYRQHLSPLVSILEQK